MNSKQLDHILRQDPFVGPLFCGVYPIDRLPPVHDGAYVINTAPALHPGLHWLALIVKGQSIEYFDSYGGKPSPKLRQWARNKSWVCNPTPLQSPFTSVCGQYCVYYLLHRARGFDLVSILMDFGVDVDENDKLVYDFVAKRYDLDHLTLVDTENIILQASYAHLSDPSIRKMKSGQ